MVIAWRVLYTLMLGRTCPDVDCEVIFDPREWRAAYIVIKLMLVAGLGGYSGRKHDGPPGPKAMWIGLQRLREFVIALEARDALDGICV